MQHNNIGIIR